jgi:hypothetical protein
MQVQMPLLMLWFLIDTDALAGGVVPNRCRRLADGVVSGSQCVPGPAKSCSAPVNGPPCHAPEPPTGSVCESLPRSESVGSGCPVNPLGFSAPYAFPSPNILPQVLIKNQGRGDPPVPSSGSPLAKLTMVPKPGRAISLAHLQLPSDTIPAS